LAYLALLTKVYTIMKCKNRFIIHKCIHPLLWIIWRMSNYSEAVSTFVTTFVTTFITTFVTWLFKKITTSGELPIFHHLKALNLKPTSPYMVVICLFNLVVLWRMLLRMLWSMSWWILWWKSSKPQNRK
jgi:hypothetical protein